MRFENVITREQDRAQARAEAQAEARAQAAQARAEAQEEAQRVREEAQEIREEAQRIREEVRERIREQMQDPNPDPDHPQIMTVPPMPPWQRDQIPPQVVDIVTMFVIAMVICIVGLPIARALGRWIDRRGVATPISGDMAAQMTRIEQAVDTMAVEVERISEAQRFQAKLLSDREKVRA